MVSAMAFCRGKLLAFGCALSTLACGSDDEGSPPTGTGGSNAATGGSDQGTGGSDQGTGGFDPGTGGETSAGTVPSDLSVEGFGAFIAAGSYKLSGWTALNEELAESTGNHLTKARIWLNDIAIDGLEEDDESSIPDLPLNSMAVKELHDTEDDTLVGVAAMLKVGENPTGGWQFYCYGPAGHCAHNEPEHPQSDPLYARGLNARCGICHGSIITRP